LAIGGRTRPADGRSIGSSLFAIPNGGSKVSDVSLVPVTVLTGFLGSGKTTLLQRLLQEEDGRRTAVLINEFGEIGLDHLLVKAVSGSTVVLQNGCVCCSVRTELRSGLRDLLDGRAKGEIPPFDRIVIETTGLADPVPVVQIIRVDPMLRNQLRLANLVSTVDAMNGIEQLGTQQEAQRQAATADRLVITKTDLSDGQQVDKLEQILSRINPMAPISRTPGDDLWKLLLYRDAFDPKSRDEEIRHWSRTAERLAIDPPCSADGHAWLHHSPSIVSFALRVRHPIDWSPFAVWLSLVVHRHGRNILRVKGLLDVPGAKGPILLNAVQHFIHPPVHLDEWPDDDHSSRLVFIVQDLDEVAIRGSLANFLRRADHMTELETTDL
jgi:G3E family GTPase